MKIQTEGFLALGDLPNDEHYRCLICRAVPSRVHVNFLVPEQGDIPAISAGSRTVILPYRLCPRCHETNPDPWRIRLLLLERLNARPEAR
jgi:hypothetical protein